MSDPKDDWADDEEQLDFENDNALDEEIDQPEGELEQHDGEDGQTDEQAADVEPAAREQSEPAAKAAKAEEAPKKESRRKRRAKQRFESLLRQNASFRQQAEEERERANQLEKRIANLETERGQDKKQSLESQYETVREQLGKATEDGDTNRQIELMEQLVDVKVQMKESARPPATESPRPAQPSYDRGAFEEWKLRNDWYSNPKYRHYAAMAESIEQTLLNQSGYQPFSTQLFEEIDRRLEAAAPEIKELRLDFDDDEDEHEGADANANANEQEPAMSKPTRQQQNRPPRSGNGAVVSGRTRQPAGSSMRKNKSQFTKQDQESLRELKAFGLDVNDAEHRKAYKKYAHRSLDPDF